MSSHRLKTFASFILLSIVGSSSENNYEEIYDQQWEIVMTAPYRLLRTNPVYSQHGNCKLKVMKDGRFDVQRRVNGSFRTAWTTGTRGTGNAETSRFVVNFEEDANLVLYEMNGYDENTKSPLYETGFTDPLEVWRMNYRHKLEIDTMCRIKIEPYDDDYLGWSSSKTDFYPMYSYLQKGDMYNDIESEPPLTMHLQQNCELVIFEGHDLADKGKIVWSSQTSNNDATSDCHVFGDWNKNTYTLGLYEGKFQPFLFTGRNSDSYSPDGKNLWKISSDENTYLFLTNEGPTLGRVDFHLSTSNQIS